MEKNELKKNHTFIYNVYILEDNKHWLELSVAILILSRVYIY